MLIIATYLQNFDCPRFTDNCKTSIRFRGTADDDLMGLSTASIPLKKQHISELLRGWNALKNF